MLVNIVNKQTEREWYQMPHFLFRVGPLFELKCQKNLEKLQVSFIITKRFQKHNKANKMSKANMQQILGMCVL